MNNTQFTSAQNQLFDPHRVICQVGPHDMEVDLSVNTPSGLTPSGLPPWKFENYTNVGARAEQQPMDE